MVNRARPRSAKGWVVWRSTRKYVWAARARGVGEDVRGHRVAGAPGEVRVVGEVVVGDEAPDEAHEGALLHHGAHQARVGAGDHLVVGHRPVDGGEVAADLGARVPVAREGHVEELGAVAGIAWGRGVSGGDEGVVLHHGQGQGVGEAGNPGDAFEVPGGPGAEVGERRLRIDPAQRRRPPVPLEGEAQVREHHPVAGRARQLGMLGGHQVEHPPHRLGEARRPRARDRRSAPPPATPRGAGASRPGTARGRRRRRSARPRPSPGWAGRRGASSPGAPRSGRARWGTGSRRGRGPLGWGRRGSPAAF